MGTCAIAREVNLRPHLVLEQRDRTTHLFFSQARPIRGAESK